MILLQFLCKVALSLWLLPSSIVIVDAASVSSCAGLWSTSYSGSLESLCWQTVSSRAKTQNSTQATLSTALSSDIASVSAAKPTDFENLGALIALIAQTEAAALRTAASTGIARYANNSSPNNATVAAVGIPVSYSNRTYSGYRAVTTSAAQTSSVKRNESVGQVSNWPRK